jgi:hypothetical protein
MSVPKRNVSSCLEVNLGFAEDGENRGLEAATLFTRIVPTAALEGHYVCHEHGCAAGAETDAHH